ncbi:hypothetical protein WDU94_000523 [Cyamophila willieti]
MVKKNQIPMRLKNLGNNSSSESSGTENEINKNQMVRKVKKRVLKRKTNEDRNIANPNRSSRDNILKGSGEFAVAKFVNDGLSTSSDESSIDLGLITEEQVRLGCFNVKKIDPKLKRKQESEQNATEISKQNGTHPIGTQQESEQKQDLTEISKYNGTHSTGTQYYPNNSEIANSEKQPNSKLTPRRKSSLEISGLKKIQEEYFRAHRSSSSSSLGQSTKRRTFKQSTLSFPIRTETSGDMNKTSSRAWKQSTGGTRNNGHTSNYRNVMHGIDQHMNQKQKPGRKVRKEHVMRKWSSAADKREYFETETRRQQVRGREEYKMNSLNKAIKQMEQKDKLATSDIAKLEATVKEKQKGEQMRKKEERALGPWIPPQQTNITLTTLVSEQGYKEKWLAIKNRKEITDLRCEIKDKEFKMNAIQEVLTKTCEENQKWEEKASRMAKENEQMRARIEALQNKSNI